MERTITVKGTGKVSVALLENAAQNARKKAEVLTKAAGVKLGELLSISYNWAELDLYSDTNYGIEARCLCDAPNIAMDITPDNIEVGDSATFVWAIA